MVWKDKKIAFLLSTIHTSKMKKVEKEGKKQIRPEYVVAYNNTISDLNRVDQNLAVYSTPKKG